MPKSKRPSPYQKLVTDIQRLDAKKLKKLRSYLALHAILKSFTAEDLRNLIEEIDKRMLDHVEVQP